jgi:hypothetical protein
MQKELAEGQWREIGGREWKKEDPKYNFGFDTLKSVFKSAGDVRRGYIQKIREHRQRRGEKQY